MENSKRPFQLVLAHSNGVRILLKNTITTLFTYLQIPILTPSSKWRDLMPKIAFLELLMYGVGGGMKRMLVSAPEAVPE